MMESVQRFYQTPGLSAGKLRDRLQSIQRLVPAVRNIDSEFCFNVGVKGNDLDAEKR